MNAIVARKTVEMVVAARDQAIQLYEAAFERVAEADEALKQARLMWKEAAPSFEGRYYDAGEETKAFFKVVAMPDRDQYLATARRLIDVTVWQHVVEVSGIEDLMDTTEKEKLRTQMQYRSPRFKTANKFLEDLEWCLNYTREHIDGDDPYYGVRCFTKHVAQVKEDPETVEALGNDGIEKAKQIANDLVAAASTINGHSHFVENLTVSVEELHTALTNPLGLPPVTVENIMATLNGLLGQSNEIFLRGVATSFASLDRRFRSHDGFKIGSRVIIDRLCDDYGTIRYGRREDTFLDIERIFKVLDGGKPGALYGSILHQIRQDRGWGSSQTEHESDFFKVRIFKNGNAHLWFTRKDLVEKVNKCLAEYYGEVVGDGMTKEEDPLNNPKTTPARYYGFFPTPEDAASTTIEEAQLAIANDAAPLRILEPSAGTGNLARPAAAERIHRIPRLVPMDNGRQRYDYDEVPYQHIVDCIELQPHLANALEADDRFNRVMCADFLSVAPDPIYDRVIMNPPFDRERDIDHVVHALKFLKPDGRLVAIMSAGTEFRETKKAQAFRKLVIDNLGGAFKDLPANSFSSVGTNVNTVVLRVNNNGSKVSRYF
ncbi:DUF4942 domain-containing protein [Roseibium sp.]|uniref:DUF4942 domain-containing protein n=1 Tax=Roseibium sp. TaxID=1936156 RepID=UPI003BAAF8D6